MVVRTIPVTKEADPRLRSHPGTIESFAHVIVRGTGRRTLSDFAGRLSCEPATRLRPAVEEDRRGRRRSEG